MLRVNKCRSFAAMLFTGGEYPFTPHMKKRYSSYDPKLSVEGDFIIFIGHDVAKDRMFKYLGHWTQDDFGTERIAELLDKRIKDWIGIIDATLLTGPMKSWILNQTVYSKVQWMLMVHDFRLGQIDKWQNLFHRKFRDWMGLAKSCEPSILYRSRENFGLNFNKLREYTKRIRVTRMQLLKCSLDPDIRRLYDYLVNKYMKLRGGSSSLRKYIPPKRRVSQLPPTLELERSLRQVKFLKIRGNSQRSRKGIQVRSFGVGISSSISSIAQRTTHIVEYPIFIKFFCNFGFFFFFFYLNVRGCNFFSRRSLGLK